MTALLEIENLRVRLAGQEVLRGIGLSLGRERLGIVGESGAGKSMLARAIMRLLPAGAAMSADRLMLDGVDLARADERTMRAMRGAKVAMVLQDPRFSLNPAIRVGEQIAEAIRAHRKLPARAARAEALTLIAAMRIRDPEHFYRRYPHQLSGGLGQRAMIGMMLAPNPALLIADEPTSALDAGVANDILALLDGEVARRGMGIIFISHDLALVAAFCDRVLVMQAGEIVDVLPAADLEQTRNPYTRRLLDARLRLDA